MSLSKRLTKHGNSLALIIDKPVLDLLGINDKTKLRISCPDGKSLMIVPEENSKADVEFEDALNEANEAYGDVLKRLADK